MPFGAITQSNFEDVSLAGIWDWWLCLCRLDSGSSGGTERFRIVLVFDISQQQELKENNYDKMLNNLNQNLEEKSQNLNTTKHFLYGKNKLTINIIEKILKKFIIDEKTKVEIKL